MTTFRTRKVLHKFCHLISGGQIFIMYYVLKTSFKLQFQVECKKAQPKEVMLPANLAKTRAAGRGAYGELVMVATPPSTYRYAPYPLPSAASAAAAAHAAAAANAHNPHHLLGPIVASSPAATYQYASSPAAAAAAAAAVYDVKRALAAAAYRPHHPAAAAAAAAAAAHAAPRATTLTYSMSDLLGVQGLDMSAMYHPIPTLGL